MKPISIAGGGIAGLTLGIRLRRNGVPVTVYEAGSYPRHRVCGEFMNGATPALLECLGVAFLAREALTLRSCVWFDGGHSRLEHRLSEPVLAISRYRLDHLLATEFTRAGGSLTTGCRVDLESAKASGEGWVRATGRPRQTGARWLGVKTHLSGYPFAGDLEMHVGTSGYTGVCRLPGGRTNLCGLFRQTARLPSGDDKAGRLRSLLAACGLDALSDRLADVEMDEVSITGVNAFSLGRQQDAADSRLAIGDSFAIIPPFTGNGMTMALEAAGIAAKHLAPFSRGEAEWGPTLAACRHELARRFAPRLRWASRLHPILFSPLARRGLASALSLGLLSPDWISRRLR